MFSPRPPIQVTEGSQTELLQPGDAIIVKDWHFVWSEHHLKNSQLEPWRRLSDDLADRVLAALDTLLSNSTCASIAPFELIKHHMRTTPVDEQHPHVQEFWEEVTRLPPLLDADGPEKAEGVELEAARAREREMVLKGQEVYTKYAGPIAVALLYFSLAGGFASPRISRALELTSYLLPPRPSPASDPAAPPSNPSEPTASSTSASTSRTFERLCETGQWIIECMDGYDTLVPPADPLAPSARGFASAPGRAWEDTVRVRLLHAQMRARLMKAARQSSDGEPGTEGDPWQKKGYDFAADGVPLNVEDLAATLASFAVAPLWCLRTMGFTLSPSSLAAYLALWRHLGFYLGVPPSILRTHFGNWARADAFLLSAVAHLFVVPHTPAARARLPTLPVLRAVAARGQPGGVDASALAYHHGLARALLGDAFARDLGVPPSAWRTRVQVRLSFLGMRVPAWLGEVYPRTGWEAKRRECIRRALPRIVCRSLGGRRARFFAGGVGGSRGLDAVEVEGIETREKAVGWQEEKWEKVDVESEAWIEEGREIVRMWNELWREMFAVLGIGAAVVGAVTWAAYTRWQS